MAQLEQKDQGQLEPSAQKAHKAQQGQLAPEARLVRKALWCNGCTRKATGPGRSWFGFWRVSYASR